MWGKAHTCCPCCASYKRGGACPSWGPPICSRLFPGLHAGFLEHHLLLCLHALKPRQLIATLVVKAHNACIALVGLCACLLLRWRLWQRRLVLLADQIWLLLRDHVLWHWHGCPYLGLHQRCQY